MDPIDAALADLALQDSPNYAMTARKYNINRSTLSRRHRGITVSIKEGRQTTSILSNQEEKCLISYINKLTERGIPPTNAMIRVFAHNISGKEPGKNWSYRFVEAHQDILQSKFLQGADLDRKKADNAYQYQLYFDLVNASIGLSFHTNIR
jgi:DNA invertase Pin-like site-specific DNA recombinase